MRFTLQLWSTDLATTDSVIGDGCASLTFFFFHWVWYTVARRVLGLSWQYAAFVQDSCGVYRVPLVGTLYCRTDRRYSPALRVLLVSTSNAVFIEDKHDSEGRVLHPTLYAGLVESRRYSTSLTDVLYCRVDKLNAKKKE